jgi:hypothetical protein
MEETRWRSYEEVAQYLLDHWAGLLGLRTVQGKQMILGRASGTSWEIDAKGVREDGGEVIVECRCRTTSRTKQEEVAALAYRIQDTGAKGGILVSPLGFQEGAARVAAATNIVSVTLKPESTTTEYVMTFLNHIIVGEEVRVKDSWAFVLRDENGNVVDQWSGGDAL